MEIKSYLPFFLIIIIIFWLPNKLWSVFFLTFPIPFCPAEEEPLKTTYGCEGRTLTVECPQGFVIRIQRANYGRLSLHPCSDDGDPEGWELDCLSTKALPTVMEL